MKLSKKTTPSLQSNMEEIQWCFQVALPSLALGALDICMVNILEHNVGCSVRKQSQKFLGFPAGQWPQIHFKKHPTMIQDKTLDCSALASNLSPDLKSTEYLCRDLTAVGTLLIWENWSGLHKRGEKQPVQRCRKHYDGYRKCLIAVILTKVHATKY